MTNNPKRRYAQHKKCQCKFTKRFNGNVYCVYLERLEHHDQKALNSIAWHREKQIKKWSPERKSRQIRTNQARTADLVHLYIN